NLKRVIAYSTLSQLGYMFAGVGIGAFGASIFHLTTHAFFKACLFLAAGIVIHELAGEEDMRLMGGLRRRLPIVWACFGIGALANAGFPLTAGFFSKDEIVSAAFATGNSGIAGLGAILLVTSGLTGFYMLRAHFLTFHGQPAPEQDRLIDPHGHGPSEAMVIPVVILALLALFGGWPYAVVGAFLEPTFASYGGRVVEGAGPRSPIALLTALVGLVGIGLAWLFYERDRSLPRRLGQSTAGLYAFLRNAWYIDDLYRGALVVPGRVLAMALSGPVDNWVVDGAVRGVAATVRWIGAELGSIQTGFVRNYALAILAGVVVILGYLMRAGG
ncbi:MAG TPA: proton-conducting transporter membrane subunit, partial [Chloroflexota bacterium]